MVTRILLIDDEESLLDISKIFLEQQRGSKETEVGLTITCEDDGVGIPANDKENVFLQGFGKHTGFGLYMVREVLGITGMQIRETGVQGKGARFEIAVPSGNYKISRQ